MKKTPWNVFRGVFSCSFLRIRGKPSAAGRLRAAGQNRREKRMDKDCVPPAEPFGIPPCASSRPGGLLQGSSVRASVFPYFRACVHGCCGQPRFPRNNFEKNFINDNSNYCYKNVIFFNMPPMSAQSSPVLCAGMRAWRGNARQKPRGGTS